MLHYIETTVCRGFPVRAGGEIERPSPSLGIYFHTLDQLDLTDRKGRRIPFIERKLKESDWDELREQVMIDAGVW